MENDSGPIVCHDDEPWKVAPACPECGEVGVTPLQSRARRADPSRLWCVACGHEYTSDDATEIARAWYGWGAYEGREWANG